VVDETDEDIIVLHVTHEQRVAAGEVIDVDSDEEEEADPTPPLSDQEILEMCAKLEAVVLRTGVDCGLEFLGQLRHFCRRLYQAAEGRKQQTTLSMLWGADDKA
jgi:hypothetical protein